MRKALVQTGTPQGNAGTGHIGPLPRVRKALNALLGSNPPALSLIAGR